MQIGEKDEEINELFGFSKSQCQIVFFSRFKGECGLIDDISQLQIHGNEPIEFFQIHNNWMLIRWGWGVRK